MSSSVIYKKVSEIDSIATSHNSGSKKVLTKADLTLDSIPQSAYGIFKPGEKVESHHHETLNEYFFFVKGKGVYTINGRDYELEPNVFIFIPAKTDHSLVNSGLEDLEFFYFGVAI